MHKVCKNQISFQFQESAKSPLKATKETKRPSPLDEIVFIDDDDDPIEASDNAETPFTAAAAASSPLQTSQTNSTSDNLASGEF